MYSLMGTFSTGYIKESLRVSLQRVINKTNNNNAPGTVELKYLVDKVAKIQSRLHEADQEINDILAGWMLSDEAKKDRAQSILQRVKDEIQTDLAEIEFLQGETKKSIAATVLPAAPDISDVAVSLQLTQLKNDIKMVLDGQTVMNIKPTLYQMVSEAAQKGDKLTLWLLTASDWTQKYLQSRNLIGLATMDYQRGIEEALRPYQTAEQRKASEYLQLFEGAEGLDHALSNFPYAVESDLSGLQQKVS